MILDKSNNILICPLEWGLGHSGRMIPLALRLQNMNNKIFIGAGHEHICFFKKELDGVLYIHFPGFRPGYSALLPQYLVLLLKLPLLFYHIIHEHIKLRKIIKRHNIDIVISDNRFGLWNRKIKTVYITHMPRIPFPAGFRWMERAGTALHRFIIKKYSFCLIPDLPGEPNLTGRLSHGVRLPSNATFTGILSRFTESVEEASGAEEITGLPHHTVILSGPEPQRSILRQKLVNILEKNKTASVFLEGKPADKSRLSMSGNILSFNHLNTPDMKKVIMSSMSIICRSGYSTVMELVSLGKSALLVPTPGQTEQEYLAGYLSSLGLFTMVRQNEISDQMSLNTANIPFPDAINEESSELLGKALKAVLKD